MVITYSDCIGVHVIKALPGTPLRFSSGQCGTYLLFEAEEDGDTHCINIDNVVTIEEGDSQNGKPEA